jgi:hypothetical protein
MSIAASTRKAFAVDAETKSAAFRQAATQPTVESGLEKLTQWIPSEVITIYIALLGIFAPDKAAGKWIVFAIGAGAVPAFVLLNAALVNKRGAAQWAEEHHAGSPPRLAHKRIAWLTLLAGVSYLVWTFALPATPFLDLTHQATRIGGALVVVVSVVMPKVAEFLDLQLPQA